MHGHCRRARSRRGIARCSAHAHLFPTEVRNFDEGLLQHALADLLVEALGEARSHLAQEERLLTLDLHDGTGRQSQRARWRVTRASTRQPRAFQMCMHPRPVPPSRGSRWTLSGAHGAPER